MLCGLNREKLAEILIGSPSPNTTISHNTTQHHRLRLSLIGLSIAYLFWWCYSYARESKVAQKKKSAKDLLFCVCPHNTCSGGAARTRERAGESTTVLLPYYCLFYYSYLLQR
jgi:hypothetical protein